MNAVSQQLLPTPRSLEQVLADLNLKFRSLAMNDPKRAKLCLQIVAVEDAIEHKARAGG